jgi:hypothetical protein
MLLPSASITQISKSFADVPVDALPPPDPADWAATGDVPLDLTGGEYAVDGGEFLTL